MKLSWGHMVFYDDWFWKRKVVAVMEVKGFDGGLVTSLKVSIMGVGF